MTRYSEEPSDPKEFTKRFNSFYGQFASAYDVGVRWLPVWKTWLRKTVPHLEGPRILEISFGTGFLLTQYADQHETFGIDLNAQLIQVARQNLAKVQKPASLLQANVEALPYADESFDTVLNTMAFTGYPDGKRALSEMIRVLKPQGRLVILDVNYPKNGNALGNMMTKFWKISGDLVRDMDSLFSEFSLDYTDQEVGGFGSIHLYIACKSS